MGCLCAKRKTQSTMAKSQSGKNTALLVGCNYENMALATFPKLENCHNDVSVMYKILTTAFGFDKKNIEVLTDKPGTKDEAMPTGANIKSALGRLISQLQFGDVLFLYFAGHGTRIPSAKSQSKFAGAIVTCDGDIITNMDFRALVDRVPNGATFTFLADCGYSGGLFRKEKEQIGPNIRSSANMSRTLKQEQGILLSSCQWDECAMDCSVDGKQFMGAFTRALQVIIQEKLLSHPFTNKELVMKAREILPTRILTSYSKLSQHPCLYCSDENANHLFLSNLPKKGC